MPRKASWHSRKSASRCGRGSSPPCRTHVKRLIFPGFCCSAPSHGVPRTPDAGRIRLPRICATYTTGSPVTNGPCRVPVGHWRRRRWQRAVFCFPPLRKALVPPPSHALAFAGPMRPTWAPLRRMHCWRDAPHRLTDPVYPPQRWRAQRTRPTSRLTQLTRLARPPGLAR